MIIEPLINQSQRVKDAYQDYLESLSGYAIHELIFFEWAILEIKAGTGISKHILYKLT